MSKVRVRYISEPGIFEKAFLAQSEAIINASHDSIVEAAEEVKVKARATIATSGLGEGFVNALRVDVYPKSRKSINAAAHVYHKIPYAGVFEDGATIRGKPMLWVPLDDTPKAIGRKRINPQLYESRVGKLQYVKRPGKNPILFAKMQVGKGQTAGQITLRRLRAGAREGAKGPFASVPLFVGISTVSIRKRLNIKEIVRNARDQLPQIYAKKIGVYT